MISLFIKTYWSQLSTLAVGLLVGCFFTSWFNAGELAIAKGDNETLKAKHSEQVAQTASAALKRIVTANERADGLQVALDNTEQRLTTSKLEKQHEIKRTTTGGACFNNATVRLLNAGNIHETARGQATGLPTSTSKPAEADAATATDTDVANWINDTKAQYNVCRSRLDALIDWESPITSTEDISHD
ncbi:hypothetical protein [Undibacterium sp. Xuan67W]|uniref:hypothetical protein n=1 Tax=Undibacterium sp. Xuan67W TaxID=3413057 RepID=UPI003BF01FEB